MAVLSFVVPCVRRARPVRRQTQDVGNAAASLMINTSAFGQVDLNASEREIETQRMSGPRIQPKNGVDSCHVPRAEILGDEDGRDVRPSAQTALRPQSGQLPDARRVGLSVRSRLELDCVVAEFGSCSTLAEAAV